MCCGPKCAIIFAGVWCLAISGAYAVLAYLAIAIHDCSISVEYSETDPGFYLYFIYFYNNCSGLPYELNIYQQILDQLGITAIPTMPTTPAHLSTLPPDIFTWPPWLPECMPECMPGYPDKFGPVEQTYNIMISYAALNTAWFVTSFVIVVACAANVRHWIAYVPWIILAAGNIILDVVATIIFGLQINETQTVLGLLEFMGVQNMTQGIIDQIDALKNLNDGVTLTMIPSLVMTLLACRVGIFWLVNIVLFIAVSVASFQLSRPKNKESKLRPYPYHRDDIVSGNNMTNDPYNGGNSNPNFVGDNTAHNLPKTSDNEYTNNLNIYQDNDYDYDTGYINTNNKPFSYVPEPAMAPKLQHPPQSNRTSANAIPRIGHHAPPEPEYVETVDPWFIDSHKPSAPTETQERPIPLVSIQRQDSTNEPRNNYENRPRGVKIRRAPDIPRKESDRNLNRPQISAVELHRRPATYDEVEPISRQSSQNNFDRQDEVKVSNRPERPAVPKRNPGSAAFRPASVVQSDELRSQLPWSYFGPRIEKIVPKSKPTDEEEDIEKPPVPVPDYTLHFGKTPRPSTSGWSEDGASSTSSVGHHHG